MARRHETTTCDQAGQWISLRLDDELSELDQVRLDRHLAGCADCSTFAAELTGITQLLRAAPLVGLELDPAPTLAARPVVPIRARRAAYGLVSSAAAAAVAFLLFGSSSSIGPSQQALQFRSAAEKAQFLRVQQVRIEPKDEHSVEPEVVTAPPMNPRGLL